MIDEEISIREIQHYLYCPHRWGLLTIDRAWAENVYVTKANLMHSRVHDPDKHYTINGKKIFTSVTVFNDLPQYNLYGVVDCLELSEDPLGITLKELPGKYKVCIVEYKPTKPRGKNYHEEDMMQVFTQKICVDYVFGCDCDAILYYADVKERIRLPLKENYELYDQKLKTVLMEMRERFKRGSIPSIVPEQKCNGCSLKDICMPSKKKRMDFHTEIMKLNEL